MSKKNILWMQKSKYTEVPLSANFILYTYEYLQKYYLLIDIFRNFLRKYIRFLKKLLHYDSLTLFWPYYCLFYSKNIIKFDYVTIFWKTVKFLDKILQIFNSVWQNIYRFVHNYINALQSSTGLSIYLENYPDWVVWYLVCIVVVAEIFRVIL